MSSSSLSIVLVSLKDVIQSEQLVQTGHVSEPSPNEYFAVLIRVLSSGGELSDSVLDFLKLLDGIINHVSPTLVREQFKTLSTLLAKIVKVSSDSFLLVIFSILGKVLQMQETSDSFWSSLHSLQVINMFLGLIDDQRTKLRKLVHSQLFSLLKLHQQSQRKCKALFAYLFDFFANVMKTTTKSDYKRSLYILFFLDTSISLFPGEMVVKLTDLILRLQSCEQNILSLTIFRTLDSMFQSTFLTLTVQQVSNVLHTVLTLRRITVDMETNCNYSTCLANGFAFMHKLSPEQSWKYLDGMIPILVDLCEAEFTQVHASACMAIKRILNVVLTKSFVQDSACMQLFGHSLNKLHELLDLKFKSAWLYSLDIVRCLFENVKGNVGVIAYLSPFVVTIGILYESVEMNTLSLDTERTIMIGTTLGLLLKYVGPTQFLQLIPFQLPGFPVYFGIDSSREWLLLVFHNYLKTFPCKLLDFQTAILPLARQCYQEFKTQTHQLSPTQYALIRTRVIQFWGLFPSWCMYGPSDIKMSFPGLATVLDKALDDVDFPELRHAIVSGLHTLATRVLEQYPMVNPATVNKSIQTDYVVLLNHAMQFVPKFLVMLESMDISDNSYSTLLHCLTAWSALSPPELIVTCAKKLLKLLLSNATNTGNSSNNNRQKGDTMDSGDGMFDGHSVHQQQDAAAGWVSVMQAIIPNLPHNMILLIYKTIKPFLATSESITLQKRAYQLLGTLITCHGDELQQASQESSRVTIFNTISENILSCHVSARNMRLRCLDALIRKLTSDELRTHSSRITSEVLLCLKDANKKSRDLSLEILKWLIHHLPTQHMLIQLCSAIVGETVMMRVAGITGLCVLLLEKRQDRNRIHSAPRNKRIHHDGVEEEEEEEEGQSHDSDDDDEEEENVEDDEELLKQIPSLLDTICVLLREENVEETRAILSFIRTCVTVLPLDVLTSILPQLVPTFTTTGLGTTNKSKFTARIRAIMRKLTKKVRQPDLIRPHVPEVDVALFDYVVKQQRRARNNKNKKKKNHLLYEKTLLDKMLGSDSEDDDVNDHDDDDNENDADDEVEEEERRQYHQRDSFRKPHMSGEMRQMLLQAQKNTNTLSSFNMQERRLVRVKATRPSDMRETSPATLEDLMEESNTRQAPQRDTESGAVKKRSRSGRDVEGANIGDSVEVTKEASSEEPFSVIVSESGQVIIKESSKNEENAGEDSLDSKSHHHRKKEHMMSSEQKFGGTMRDVNDGKSLKKQKTKLPGEEYRASKAGGDVWKKGMLEPHAFIPLDPRLLSKKNHRQAVETFSSVIQNSNKSKSSHRAGNRKQRESLRVHGK